MRFRAVFVAAIVAALALATLGFGAGSTPAAAADASARTSSAPPKRVVIIVIDQLSREVVRKYHMPNVRRLMRSGADSPRGYLGHLSSVTAVTHNVITSGLLPKHMGWVSEAYRDVDGIFAETTPDHRMWSAWSFTDDQVFELQSAYPKLADYLKAKWPGRTVATFSPKDYPGYEMGGEASDINVTMSGADYDCDGDGEDSWRGPDGINVPGYLSSPVCGRWYVDASDDLEYDTGLPPAWIDPIAGNKYVVGFDPAHQGGDVWATDAALTTMHHERNWSGIFLTLPGVDNAGHAWGPFIDPGGPVPMTHMARAAKVADQQVGRVMDYLRDAHLQKETLVVLTSDHGGVPAKHFHGVNKPGWSDNAWSYGYSNNDGEYNDPQPALKPLIATGNVEWINSGTQENVWLRDRSPAKMREAAKIMARLPDTSAIWMRKGNRYQLATKVQRDRMTVPEYRWFREHAQELMNTMAADNGPDLVATLIDNTTYTVAGDHGGPQRRAQRIPIVFAGARIGSRDLRGAVRSVDIMPTILREMRLPASHRMDGRAYRLPHK